MSDDHCFGDEFGVVQPQNAVQLSTYRQGEVHLDVATATADISGLRVGGGVCAFRFELNRHPHLQAWKFTPLLHGDVLVGS